MKMISPWINFYREIEALFAKDPDITVKFNEEDNEVKLLVRNQKKADALTKLLPTEKTFGNVTVKITVVPANLFGEDRAKLFLDAFEGNPAVAEIVDISLFGSPIHYISFVPEVVQYHNDDISDLHGNRSTLYADLARSIFDPGNGIFFCTSMLVKEE